MIMKHAIGTSHIGLLPVKGRRFSIHPSGLQLVSQRKRGAASPIARIRKKAPKTAEAIPAARWRVGEIWLARAPTARNIAAPEMQASAKNIDPLKVMPILLVLPTIAVMAAMQT